MAINILITIGHPAHVHFYKNFIWEMMKRGHKVKILASKKDVSINLLNAYGFNYDQVSSQRNKGFARIKDQLVHEYNSYEVAKKFKPDIITGIGGTTAAHISKITKSKSIIFTDTEHTRIANKITVPFADVICTPSCYYENLGNKQVRYNGCHELAYLHPNYFTPDPSVLSELGLTENDPFIILRFISWNAGHDIGQHGIDNKKGFVKMLENYGEVFITSEGKLDLELEKYKLKVSPEKLHDLLYYASLYIGEGGTTALESAILGTHSIHISTTAKYCGIFEELHNYGLIWTFDDERGVIELVKKLLAKPSLWRLGKEKRDLFVRDQINVTDFMIWLFENCPEDLSVIKQTPEINNKLVSGEFL